MKSRSPLGFGVRGVSQRKMELGGDVHHGQCLSSITIATIPKSVTMEIKPSALKFSLFQVLP